MTTPNPPNAAERPSDRAIAQVIVDSAHNDPIDGLRCIYAREFLYAAGKANSRFAQAAMYDGKTWLEGISGGCNIVTYNGEDVRGIGYIADSVIRAEVIAAHNRALDSHHPAESVSADHPECSGDPACCPENEGFGCCKPNPQPSTPGAVSDEDVKQWGYALERAIESQRLLAEGIDKDNPEDPWASLLVHEDVAQLGNLATALESFAKRSAEAKGGGNG